MFEFHVIGGDAAHGVISADREAVVSLVKRVYAAHGSAHTINPDSYFLRFPEKPSARIIALPAYLGDGLDVAGIKWIASFPTNVSRGIPRASAVLILNDSDTGYPFACLESAIVSAARTAASAVLGAQWLMAADRQVRKVGFIGAGVISRHIAEFFAATGWSFDKLSVFDLSRDDSMSFARHVQKLANSTVVVAPNHEEVIRSSELIVFATSVAQPYVHDPHWFAHGPVVLNISLRDLAPEVILAATNVVDDVAHCLKANTSPHLAEQLVGHRRFIAGTLDQVIRGVVRLPASGPCIFSPFGLGVLDLAVGMHVYRYARERGLATRIPNFFYERARW